MDARLVIRSSASFESVTARANEVTLRCRLDESTGLLSCLEVEASYHAFRAHNNGTVAR